MDFSGRRVHADYRRFQVSDKSSKYSLTCTSYSEKASDALAWQIEWLLQLKTTTMTSQEPNAPITVKKVGGTVTVIILA